MSSVVTTLTPFVEKDVLLCALQDLGVSYTESGQNILTEREDYQGNQTFVWTNGQFFFQHERYRERLDTFKEWKTTDSFLKAVETAYQNQYTLKLERLAEAERLRLEAERAAFVVAQEQRIVEKAKALGYKVEKRTEKDKGVQFVLVKRSL